METRCIYRTDPDGEPDYDGEEEIDDPEEEDRIAWEQNFKKALKLIEETL